MESSVHIDILYSGKHQRELFRGLKGVHEDFLCEI
jgi:hypothetical protein